MASQTTLLVCVRMDEWCYWSRVLIVGAVMLPCLVSTSLGSSAHSAAAAAAAGFVAGVDVVALLQWDGGGCWLQSPQQAHWRRSCRVGPLGGAAIRGAGVAKLLRRQAQGALARACRQDDGRGHGTPQGAQLAWCGEFARDHLLIWGEKERVTC